MSDKAGDDPGFEPSEQLRSVLADAQSIGAIGQASLVEHVAHAVAFARAWEHGRDSQPTGIRLLDLGSGAGLPGLVLAEARPDLHCTLLDGRAQRAQLLEQAVERLAMTERVEVVFGRAEERGRQDEWRGAFDVVVARGFASPPVTAECAAPFLRVGGLLVVSEPPGSDGALRWPPRGCAEFGLELERELVDPFAFAVLRQSRLCPSRYPRRVGIPTKRPVF